MMTERARGARIGWPLLPVLMLVATGVCGVWLARQPPGAFDVAGLRWFRTGADGGQIVGPEGITVFWLGLTWLGDATQRVVVGCAVVFVLWLRRRGQGALLALGIFVSGSVLSSLVKLWVARPRPQLVAQWDHVGSASFPSGHALAGVLFYVGAALLLGTLLQRRAARVALYAFAVGLAAAIGVSRVALGVHWPTDVLASWVIGGAWLWLWHGLAARHWRAALAACRT